MNILLLYPKFPETFWNSRHSVEVLSGRKAIMPPLGLLTIASYLPQDFSIRLIDRNRCEETAADWEWADVVFLSVMLAQRDDYDACARRARLRGKPIAVGGPFTHAVPETACADADWVCFGEAENIMEEFVADVRADRRGRRYHGGSATDMESVKIPRFDLLPAVNDYITMPLQFSRGCPFRCEFCDIIEIYGRVPRTKTPRQITRELAALEETGFRGAVFLVDDNFIGNKKRAKSMLEDLARWNREHKYPFRYYTEASINLADDEELMQRMAVAGFFHVFIGIETPDPGLLKTTQKMQNIPGDPLKKLAKVRAHGMHITGGFIVGFDGEDRRVFETQKNFIQASGIGVAMVGLLQAIPHTQLWRRLKAEGRLLETTTPGGNISMEGINFIPKGAMTKRDYLENYSRLLGAIYSPHAYFTRALPALLSLQSKIPLRALWRGRRELLTVLGREMYHLGVKDKAMRVHFWKTFLRLLWKNPAALEAFAFDVSVFHHLHRHSRIVQSELSRYLSSPVPGDVLSRVIENCDPLAAAARPKPTEPRRPAA